MEPIVSCQLCETVLTWKTPDLRQVNFVGHTPELCRDLTKGRIRDLQAALKQAAQNYAEQHARDRRLIWLQEFDIDRLRNALHEALEQGHPRTLDVHTYERLKRMAENRDVQERARDLAAEVERLRTRDAMNMVTLAQTIPELFTKEPK